MQRSTGWIAGIALTAALTLTIHTLFASHSYPRRQKTQAELNQLNAQNNQLRDKIGLLQARIRAHRTRNDVKARAIRDELNYVESNDVILDFRAK